MNSPQSSVGRPLPADLGSATAAASLLVGPAGACHLTSQKGTLYLDSFETNLASVVASNIELDGETTNLASSEASVLASSSWTSSRWVENLQPYSKSSLQILVPFQGGLDPLDLQAFQYSAPVALRPFQFDRLPCLQDLSQVERQPSGFPFPVQPVAEWCRSAVQVPQSEDWESGLWV